MRAVESGLYLSASEVVREIGAPPLSSKSATESAHEAQSSAKKFKSASSRPSRCALLDGPQAFEKLRKKAARRAPTAATNETLSADSCG